jgi:hypothetical protein
MRPTLLICFRVEDVPDVEIESEVVRCSACNARCWLSVATKKDMSDLKIECTILCFPCSKFRNPEELGQLISPGPATRAELGRLLTKILSRKIN